LQPKIILKLKKGILAKVLRKLLVSFMSLAFFYLIIGDLIIFHQRAIFNYDAYGDYPLNKPGDKNDKSKVYKVKDKKKKSFTSNLTFVSELVDIIIKPYFSYDVYDVALLFDFNIIDGLFTSVKQRGPPLL